MKDQIGERIKELKAGMARCIAQANRDKRHEVSRGEIKTIEDLECYEVVISRLSESIRKARQIDAAIFELEQIQKLTP